MIDQLFQDKKTPKTLSKETRTLIELIGQTKNKSVQEDIIKKEIIYVKEQIASNPEPQEYPDILVKLIYFQTLGYDTSFAHILPINLCQSSNPYMKKISYLLAALLVKPGQELGVLMNNTIQKDLNSQNAFVIMTTLTMLRYFLTEQLLERILPQIRRLLKHQTSIIRKKSYLLLYNIYQVFPKLVEDIKHLAIEALHDPQTPVIFTGLSLLHPLVLANPHLFKDQAKRLVQILYNVLQHKYPKEYDYHRIPAPWIMISLLQMLQVLGRNDQQTSSLMYQVLQKQIRYCTNLSSSKNPLTKLFISAKAFFNKPQKPQAISTQINTQSNNAFKFSINFSTTATTT